MNLREWQATALEHYSQSDQTDYGLMGTPGCGKSRWASAVADHLRVLGEIRRVIIVVPTSHLKTQWRKAAHDAAGLEIDDRYPNHGPISRDADGIVVTYQAVAAASSLYRMLASDEPTLVILDEIHRAGVSKVWGAALHDAFELAERRLMLSGTPFRSDNSAIPFVQYDVDGRCVMDYSYDYSDALRDGIVRPVVFQSMDGRMQWHSGGEDVESSLKNDDEQAAARALHWALRPDADWMRTYLARAAVELDEMREFVPDAGGLVIAYQQREAEAYAKILHQITGEEQVVVVSDDPMASAKLKKYASGTSKWLVAVRMVSEGVDIPRLMVGVYATEIKTEMTFRQIVGRFVRTRPNETMSVATLYIPASPVFAGYAREIERIRDRVLQEQTEQTERAERTSAGPGVSEGSNLEYFLGSSDAVHDEAILSSKGFEPQRTEAARAVIKDLNLPLTPAQLCMAYDAFTPSAARHATAPPPPVSGSRLTLRDQLRARCVKEAKEYAFSTQQPGSAVPKERYREVFLRLNRECGGAIETANVESLKRRLTLLAQWRAER
jgi:superfamily II DNA or RNA helicase